MKHLRSRGVRTTCVLLTVLTLGCRGGGADALVVEIDDGGVPLAELEAMLNLRLSDEGEERREDILHEELDRLVIEKIELRRARELGIEISEQDVTVWIERLHGPDFEPADATYRALVKSQLARDRAALRDLAEAVRVTEDDIASYFEKHRDEYQKPARIQIRQIVLQDELPARNLRDKLRDGADFSALAEANSVAPEASQGGMLPPFARGELPEVFDRAFDLDLDEVSGVVESPYGFHIFLLVARFPAQVPELGDVRNKILAELETRHLAELRRDWRRDLRRASDIRVNERVLEALL